ncbi:Odorant receptor 50d [Blattella germanica]|nr:Odorant receptor 50d [Blattella germanica]
MNTCEKHSRYYSEHEECTKIAVMFLRIGGLWSLNSGFIFVNRLYYIYSSFTKFMTFYFLIAFILELFANNTLEETMEILILWITSIHLLAKLLIFHFNKQQIEILFETVKNNFSVHKHYLTTENRKIILSTMQMSRKINIFYAVLLNLGMTFYVDFVPLVTSVTYTNGTTIMERKLPFKVWVPLDITTSAYYVHAYVFLTVASHILATLLVATQSVFLTLIICLTGQFELLCDALRNMLTNVNYRLQHNSDKGSTKWKSKELEEDASYSDEPTDLFLAEAEIYLKECIKHHQSLIEFAEKFDNVWKTTFFVQFLTASFLVCFLGFQAMLMPFGLNLIKMLIFIFVELFELGVACKFGSDLMTQSEDVYRAVYDSDWYNQSTRFKQSARMLIMRAQKPVRLTAGRLGILSQPLFAAILRSSYSYLALLRQMHDD